MIHFTPFLAIKLNTELHFPLTVMAKSEQGKYNKGLVILPMLGAVQLSL